jgi:hypothetical protein
VALVLEDFAMGHRVNQDRATKRLTSSAGQVQSPELSLTDTKVIEQSNPLAFFLPAGFDYVQQALLIVPPPSVTWRLVEFYFSSVEWYTKVWTRVTSPL